MPSGHSSKSREDAAATGISKLERRRLGKGEDGRKKAVQCCGDLHSMFAPGAFLSVSHDLPSALTKLNPSSPPISITSHHGKLSHCTSWFLSGENKLENVPTCAHPVHTFRKFSPGNETSPVLQSKTPGIVQPTPAPHSSGCALLTGGDRGPPVPVCLAWHKTDHCGERTRNQ